MAGLNEQNGGFTREVQGNELASTHLEQLGRNDNRVLQQARMRGAQAGASRGGINSNLAAAGGEQSWLNEAGGVAQQQANAYGEAAGQNLESLGRQRIAELNSRPQTIYMGNDRDAQLDREWRSSEAALDRGHQLQREDDAYVRTGGIDIFRNMMNSPEEWDNFQASGAFNFFRSFMNVVPRGTPRAPPP